MCLATFTFMELILAMTFFTTLGRMSNFIKGIVLSLSTVSVLDQF